MEGKSKLAYFQKNKLRSVSNKVPNLSSGAENKIRNFGVEKVMENVAQRRVRAQVQLIDKLIRRISSQSGSNILHAKLKKGLLWFEKSSLYCIVYWFAAPKIIVWKIAFIDSRHPEEAMRPMQTDLLKKSSTRFLR